MIQNYVTTHIRNLKRQKFNTVVIITGLTAGITFALLIGLFIRAELSINQQLRDVDRLFLVETNVKEQESAINFFSAGMLTKEAAEQYPGAFENYYRFWDRNITVSKGDQHFRIQSMIGDSTMLEMFGFPVLHGDGAASNRARSAVITEDVAMKFFGKTDVIGETVSISTEVNGIQDYTINAVIREPEQKNTVTDLMDMNAQIFLFLHDVADFLPGADPDRWDNGVISFIKLAPGNSSASAEQQLNQLFRANVPAPFAEQRTIGLAPLSDYYLLTNHSAVLKLIVSLTVMVAFILLLSIANFINMAVSTALRRAKEVGIRKVIGGKQYQLVIQFLLESTSLSLFSTMLALLLFELLSDYVNILLAVNLPRVAEFSLSLWIYIGLASIAVGILAGIYPAVFQSRLKPSESLKGTFSRVKGTLSFSRILLGVQFIITLCVLTATLVLYRQTDFLLASDLGYTTSNIITVTSVPRNWTDEGFQKLESAKTALLQSPNVEEVSLSWGAPGFGMGGLGPVVYKAEATAEQGIPTNITGVDELFDDTFGLTMKEGTFLCPSAPCYQPLDIVVNEAASSALQVSTGDKLKFQGNDTTIYTIAGIVHDFHYQSMHETVKPAVFMHNRDFGAFRFLTFRLQPMSSSQSLAEVERLWKAVFPGEAFTYEFADQRVEAQYKTEMQLKNAASVAIALMLIMVLTGVLGLVSLNVSRRVKEIGIRKVLGATVADILRLIFKEYAILTVISFLLALPLAYYFGTTWLAIFAYRISLDAWLFIVPGVILLTTTLLIVSIQSFRTATTDPVKTLRHD